MSAKIVRIREVEFERNGTSSRIFIVRDHNGQALAFVYCDEAWHMTPNIGVIAPSPQPGEPSSGGTARQRHIR